MTAETDNTVVAADVMLAQLPLGEPVQLGEQRITQREYVVLQLELEDGSLGHAYAYTRGLPLFEIACLAAQRYIGGRVEMRRQLRNSVLGPAPAPHATMARGVSLCDIALWDAWCRSISRPLWQVLGGARTSVPAMPVIGYGMTPEKAAEETARLTGMGFKTIKLMIDGRDVDADAAVMKALAGALPRGCRFGIDAHWSWKSASEAKPLCRIAESLGAVFVEDPVAPASWRAAAEIADSLSMPVAMGEDITDLAALRDIAEVAGIVRVDASVMGGVTGTVEAMALARSFNRPVIPHVFPMLHAQFGFVDERMQVVEMIMPEVGADPIDQYIEHPLTIENGEVKADSRPGAGTALDFDEISKFSVRQEKLKQ